TVYKSCTIIFPELTGENEFPLAMHRLPKGLLGRRYLIIRLKVTPGVIAYPSIEDCINARKKIVKAHIFIHNTPIDFSLRSFNKAIQAGCQIQYYFFHFYVIFHYRLL